MPIMAVTGIVRAEGRYPPDTGQSIGLTLLHVILFSSILALLFLLDILTTQIILGMGGVELNPLMTGIVTTPLLHVLLKCGILMMVIPVALIAEARVRRSGVMLYAVLIAMYTVININNLAVLLPHMTRALTG